MRRAAAITLLGILAVACSREDPRRQPGATTRQAITYFTDQTELFVEFGPFVKGEETPLAVHLTKLDDFKPVRAGRVIVTLSGGGPEESFEATKPQVPGIYRPTVRPTAAGRRELAIVLERDGSSDRHELGTVSVHEDARAAANATPPAEQGAAVPITFLKEQQWATDFATARVTEHEVRQSLAANGTIRARPDGEAKITAPVAGRFVKREGVAPRIGADVVRDEVLALIAPRLGTEADVASLELATARARLNLEHARRERQRLEGLFREEAVPERRVVEARHDEAEAEAEHTAATKRLAQYQGTQRAAGTGASGMVAVRSPIAGTLVAVDVGAGAYVEEGRDLFTVVDLDRLWLEVKIPEADIARARSATGAWFEVEGFERPFEVGPASGGRVVAFGSAIDPQSRTAPLIFDFPNPDRSLRVGAFARVHVLTGAPIRTLAIPASAVVQEGGQDVAYVEVGGEAFERRRLVLGVRDGDLVQVESGLTAGERVVTRGAYEIRLAAASGAIPAHGHVH